MGISKLGELARPLLFDEGVAVKIDALSMELQEEKEEEVEMKDYFVYNPFWREVITICFIYFFILSRILLLVLHRSYMSFLLGTWLFLFKTEFGFL